MASLGVHYSAYSGTQIIESLENGRIEDGAIGATDVEIVATVTPYNPPCLCTHRMTRLGNGPAIFNIKRLKGPLWVMCRLYACYTDIPTLKVSTVQCRVRVSEW